MEIDSLWMNSWIVPGISVAILLCIAMGMLMCVCFMKKNRRLNNMQMVSKNLDPEVFTSEGSKSHAEHGFFRKLSVLSTKSSGITSKLNNNLNYAKRERRGSKDELMDSMDDSNSFDYDVLHVDNTDMDNFCIDLSDESDETISCLSDESKFTAYSTFTLTRGSSFAETLKSALSYSDIDKF